MIYKQYTSKELNKKKIPKNGEIVQISVQSRPNTYLLVNDSKFLIGDAGVLEWDDILLKSHLVNNEQINVIFQILDEESHPFDGALIDILYNNSKEEDLNLESL